VWDASGVFEELAVAGDEAGTPSARTLLLLYAADLAFRLRWEVRPALADGRTVVAAPYVDTAIAFGLAAGISRDWLKDLFLFAPKPSEARRVDPRGHSAMGDGFVEFASARCTAAQRARRRTRQRLIARTRVLLRARPRRAARRRPSRGAENG
jgi:hypothetical protein